MNGKLVEFRINFYMHFVFHRVHFVKCDVSKAEDWMTLWDEAERFLGGNIDLLLNNAGLHPGVGTPLYSKAMLQLMDLIF